jgi:hypothetical protein
VWIRDRKRVEILMSNLYYTPERFGLCILGELDEDLSYEFNMLVVWGSVGGEASGGGKMWWEQDSGCSCPAPFEECHGVQDLNNLRPDTWASFESEVMNFPADLSEKMTLLAKLKPLVFYKISEKSSS